MSLSKQKNSFNRKLLETRYTGWLKRLENDTPAMRERYEEQPRSPRQKQKDDIQHYAQIESDALKAIRELIGTKNTRFKNSLLRANHSCRLLDTYIEFNEIPLSTIERIREAQTLVTELYELKEICENFDEVEYYDYRININRILNKTVIPLYDQLYGKIEDFIDELPEFAEELNAYVDIFYKTYLHYKNIFEEAHELKRRLLNRSTLQDASVNGTLFLYVLVHGDIPYNGDELIMTPSPVNVFNLLHSSPGCVFFSSGQERRLYSKVNMFIDKYRGAVASVIDSTIPVMSKVHEKVTRNTLSKRSRSIPYVSNFLDHSKVERFHTGQGEDIINKNFSFELRVRPLHISKNFNLEGIKVIREKQIEDAIDLVDYLELKINDSNQIIFNMRDIFNILPDIENIVMIDASCQSSIHSPHKTAKNYKSVTQRSQYRK